MSLRKKLFLSLAVFSTFLIVLFSSIFSYMYNIKYYDRKYEQYGIYIIFRKEVAINATKNIMDYFKSKNDLDKNFFNEKERSHLRDVKILIQRMKSLLLLSWLILILSIIFSIKIYKENAKEFLLRISLYSGIFIISLALILALIYYSTGFNFLFIEFHKLFFQENYAFNPLTSNMKALFPDEFFLDISIDIFIRVLLTGFFLIGISVIFRKAKFSLLKRFFP